MSFYQKNFKSVSLFAALFMLLCVSSLHATGDDYNVWCQAKSSDFSLGECSKVLIDPANDSLQLEKNEAGDLFAGSGEFISPKFKAEEAFDVIFLSWIDHSPNGTGIRVFVRVGDENEAFNAWSEVKKESELMFDSGYCYIQYKIQMISESCTVSPEFKSIAIYYTDLKDEMKDLKTSSVDYPTKAELPEIIEREQWGALEPSGGYSYQVPEAVILHHSWLPTVAQYQGAATIRGIQDYHMHDPNTGWSDIGYHFLIGPDGVIYRGRPENAVGAHCVPNSDKIGICCIGNYDPDKDPLSEKTYESLKKLVAYLASKYKVSTNNLYGHRDFSPKTCPGETVYQKLPELKKTVENELGSR